MKRKDLPSVTPPDPDQIRIAGIAPVSMGERLGWLVAHVHADRMAGRNRPGLFKLFERAVASASGGDLEAIAFGVNDKVLQLTMRQHIGGKLVDRLGLHAPHVERRQAKLRKFDGL